MAMPSGPFRHVGLSKAARTHRLRKLRTPAKCRECNSYVYFQGAECEEVCGARTLCLGVIKDGFSVGRAGVGKHVQRAPLQDHKDQGHVVVPTCQ